MFGTAIERLPQLADLGVTAILLLPPAEYPGYTSQGYNPAAIFAVETDFGGPDALKQLIEAAHGHNLAVLCDVVYNHVDQNNNILRVFDGWQDDSHPDGIYFYEYGRINTPFGGPRPDYGRGEVRQFLRDNALMWLEDYRFDGLRWDTTNYIRTVDGHPGWDIPDGWELMRWANDEINRRQPWKISIAEDMQDYGRITQTTGEGGAGFDSQWAAHFYKAVRSELTQAWDQYRSMPAIRDVIQYRYNANALSRVIYTESHDEVSFSNGKRRLPTDITPEDPESWYAKKRSTLGAALVFTSPGIPMIFQGQEFIDEAQWVDNVPLDWTKRDARAGIVSLYRDLIALRRNRHYTTWGLRGQNVNDDDKLIAFHRYASGGPRDDVIVVLNMANRSYEHYTLGVPRGGWWRVRFNSDWIGYDPGFGEQPTFDTMAWPTTIDGMASAVDIGIGPYTCVILSQDD
jgi:1,4-alpha-glucan branching enzyme